MKGYTICIRVSGGKEKVLVFGLSEDEAYKKVIELKRYASEFTQVWSTATTHSHVHEYYKDSREKFEEYYDKEI